MRFLPFFLLLFIALPTFADDSDSDIASQVLAQHDDGPIIRELNWLNLSFMDKQRKSVNNLTATHYGKRLRGDKSDIATLQRLVNDELIDKTDKLQLQALGVVLGDILVAEHAKLIWAIYEDDEGVTQAVCIKDSKDCLFPITMLSRRMEVGLKPDVQKVYNDAYELIKPLLPRLPYSTN